MSPFAALASASRNEPGPLSLVVVTVMVAARNGVMASARNAAAIRRRAFV